MTSLPVIFITRKTGNAVDELKAWYDFVRMVTMYLVSILPQMPSTRMFTIHWLT